MSDEKAIRVQVWNGDRKQYDPWSEKVLAKAECKGYRKLLLRKKQTKGFDVVPTEDEVAAAEAEVSKTETDQNILKLDKLNKQAYMELILSIDTTTTRGSTAFRLVKNCRTKEYPDGNSFMAWERLKSKYAPRTSCSLMKHKKKYENSSLGDATKDPDDWISSMEGIITEIESIDEKMAISDKDFLFHILNNLPKEYDVVLDGLERQLDETGDKALTLEMVREKLSERYARIKMEVVDDDNDGREHEKALFAKDWHPPQFKGSCHKCGKYGHKGVHCRDDGKSKFPKDGRCWFCAEKGHQLYACEKFEAERVKSDKANLACEEEDSNESINELGF
jgi:hypothetical protein